MRKVKYHAIAANCALSCTAYERKLTRVRVLVPEQTFLRLTVALKWA